jgi:hypothetical protein
MSQPHRTAAASIVVVVALLAILGAGAAGLRSHPGSATPSSTSTATSTSTSTSSTSTTSTSTTTAPPLPPPRAATTAPGTPFATAGAVTLALPATSVERVGLHQSHHEGAVDLAPTAPAPAVPVLTLESRERRTQGRTAADVVTSPDATITAPVTGRVKRAGSYTLYCRYADDYVVIEPDAHPGWEVKLLHLVDERVSRGQRVVAGETVVAAHARQLPFASQVDELDATGSPWPHVHVEVVDPSIRNVPSPGGGC